MATMNEKDTRNRIIDKRIKEASWKICEKRGQIKNGYVCTEFPISGLKNTPSGEGYIDYVMLSDSGLPIGIVESKRYSISTEAGRIQAHDYADAIYEKYNVYPVIYMTNGKYIKIDDGNGPTREISGFHKKDEIERLIKKRDISLDLGDITSEIANRPYQLEAIKSVYKNWSTKEARSLLVLATGTGKTRVACAIAKILLDKNYAYRVLFLADQKNLVRQAKEETFDKYLKEYPMAVMMDGEWEGAADARIVFSTYQTMRNAINDVSQTPFGIGHFDLIIPDEVHRSIFNKYGEVMNYFDALFVGLTATPKDEVHKSTYKVFNIDNNEPTYDYSLVKAVRDGYLRYYRALDRTPEILKMGLRYDDLSDEEKEQYEDLFADGETIPDKIDGKWFYEQIINRGTIRAVLEKLNEEGIRTQDGKLGKTIIFAKDHRHAETIREEFRKMYPELCISHAGDSGIEYCTIIDSQVKYNEALQRSFKTDNKIRIVISVDMMDTGVDIPEVVNLVFFKRVLSKIKFNQMIGRGTRRCDKEEIISQGEDYFERKTNDRTKRYYKDKQGFLIFDICGNFDFFSVIGDPANISNKLYTNYQKAYKEKFGLYASMGRNLEKLNSEELALYDELGKSLIEKVTSLNDNYLSVRNNQEIVNHYKNKNNWGLMSAEKEKQFCDTIGYLVSDNLETKEVLFIDRIFNKFLASSLNNDKKGLCASAEAIFKVAKKLKSKSTNDEIRKYSDELKYLMTDAFIKDVNIIKMEDIRKKIRELTKYINEDDIITIISDFEDKILSTGDSKEIEVDFSLEDFKSLDERIINYIKNHKNEGFVYKIANLMPLQKEDLDEMQKTYKDIAKDEKEFAKLFKDKESLSIFTRKNIEPTQEALEKFYIDCYNAGLKTEDDNDKRRKLPYAKQVLNSVFKNGYLDKYDLLKGPLSFDGRLDSEEIKWLINRIAEFAPVKATIN